MGTALVKVNGGTVYIFSCAECSELCEQVPVTVTGWSERWCSLRCCNDWFHNLNTRRKRHAN